MIVFVTTTGHQYTVCKLLQRCRTALAGRFITLTYAEFLSWHRLPAGNYIFADVERLDPHKRALAGHRAVRLTSVMPGYRCLNHPTESLDRARLLDALHRRGINDFRVRAITADPEDLRYPVFVRHTIEHNGSLTGLIPDANQLRACLKKLRREPSLNDRDLLLVEYVDVRNAAGLHEKYSLFRVGDRYFGTDVSVHSDWVCKGEDHEVSPPEWTELDLDYQRGNPHVAALRPVFELARIEYGRADYAFHRGRLQVFEINTNPMIALPADTLPRWQPSLALFNRNYIAAMAPLAVPAGRRRMIAVPGQRQPLVVDSDSPARRRLRNLLRVTGQLHREHELVRRRNQWRVLMGRDSEPGRSNSTPAGAVQIAMQEIDPLHTPAPDALPRSARQTENP